MLRGGNALTVGVGIVIEVIRKNNSDYDLEHQTGPVPKPTDPIYLGTLLRQFALHIPDFMQLIKTAGAASKELKVAFGGKVESLGFDRFKTCELMAELLHCSNMILLNQRGAEAEVRARDAERTKLKAEGKLAGYLDPMHDTGSMQDFGTSVDSSGFHHARAPSFGDGSADRNRLEVSNSTEEDFETVTADNIDEDVKVDFEDRDEPDIPIILSEHEQAHAPAKHREPSTPKAATLNGPEASESIGMQNDLHDEVAQQLEALTISTSPQPAPDPPSVISHPEDKPAPLFSPRARPRSPRPRRRSRTPRPRRPSTTTCRSSRLTWTAPPSSVTC